MESERLSTMRKVIRKIDSDERTLNSSITVLCNEQRKKFYIANSRVKNTLTYPEKGFVSKIASAGRMILNAKRYDLSVAVLNGNRHFLKSKLLFWLLRSRNRLVFDGKLNSFLLNYRTFPGLFSKKRKKAHKAGRINVLLFETDDYKILQEAIRITGGDHVIPRAKITVFCRDSTAELFSSNSNVNKVISYQDHSFFSWIRQSIKTIAARNTVVAAVLNGRKRFFVSKLLFWLSRNRHRLVFNGSLDCAFWNRHTYVQIIVQGLKAGVNSPFADNPRKVLVLETAGPETMKKLIRKAAEPEVNPNARIILFCNESRIKTYSSVQVIEKIISYSDTSIWARLTASIKIVFSYPDVVTARFSGRRDFILLKILFWLIRTSNRIVFNEKLDCFYFNRKTARYMFSVRDSSIAEDPERIEALLFETDDYEILQEAIRITRGNHVIPGARITVFCRNSTAKLFSSNPLVNRVISYQDHSFFSWLRKAIKTIAARNTVIVGVLNRRKKFFISKLLFCLCRNRHRLVFNSSLDCGFWNRHTYGQIILQGLKAEVNSPFADNPRKVLVLETAGPETMKKLIRTAAEPRVNPNARITLFCNESRREAFSSIPEMEILTYSDTSLWKKLTASVKIIFTYPDAVVARFSGRHDFRPLKTLFWLVRTPNRIVFNETLDCFYLNRKTAGLLFHGRDQHISGEFLIPAMRKIIKVFLFIPRFAYLLSWRGITVLKLRLKG